MQEAHGVIQSIGLHREFSACPASPGNVDPRRGEIAQRRPKTCEYERRELAPTLDPDLEANPRGWTLTAFDTS